tara:strand:- start:52 stop:633 length:582 start_codon:yes stop_codon:yes gene_type:complete
MKYGRDQNNKEILINTDLNNYQTMMEWEKPYMEYLVDNLKPFGNVLEIGFGLGYSASQIQKHDIKSHTIIECEKIVLENIEHWKKNKQKKIIVKEGYWQDILDSLDVYDCIFYDDAPSVKYNSENLRFRKFLESILPHVKSGTRMTWYAEQCDIDFSNYPGYYSAHDFKIIIPDNCQYNKNKNKMLCPLIEYK